MSRPGRVAPAYLVLFASLYALQGVVVAYLFNFNKSYMMAARTPGGVSLSLGKVGLVQTLALLPLVLKFLAGPISDRVNLLGFGHRRPYIAIGVLAQSAGLIGLAFTNAAQHLAVFAAFALLAVAGLGLYDTCCDGMVVDVTPPEDRSRVQGILWGTRFLAAMLCTLAFGFWIGRLGGPAHADHVLLACAGLGLVPLILGSFVSEPSRAADTEQFQWSALRVLIRPWSLTLLAFGGLYGLTGMGVETNLSPYYASQGFDPGSDVGLLGAARYLGRAAGALLLPVALHRLGRGRVLTLGVLLLAGSIGAQTLVSSRLTAAVFGFLFGLANGWCDALFGVLAMEGADPRLAASTFALFMAVTNLSSAGDAFFSQAVVASGNRYHPVFLASALLALATWPLTRVLAHPAPASEPSG